MLAELFAGMALSHEGHTTYLLFLWDRVNKLVCSLVRGRGQRLQDEQPACLCGNGPCP